MSWLPGINGTECVVKYVDYGNSELVTIATLQQLQPKHCTLPEQAICCTLISACCPADGWRGEVCQFILCDLNSLLLFVCLQVVQQFIEMVTNATLLLSVIGMIVIYDVCCYLLSFVYLTE